MTTIYLIWFLLAKHYLCDYPLQSESHLKYKGVYGHPLGAEHSLIHGLSTMAVLVWFTTPLMVLSLGLLDAITHYHIDWLKSNYGEKDFTNRNFWCHLGLDQLAHQFVYITIAVVLL